MDKSTSLYLEVVVTSVVANSLEVLSNPNYSIIL